MGVAGERERGREREGDMIDEGEKCEKGEPKRGKESE